MTSPKNVTEVNNILLAIRKHCVSCMGGNKEDVSLCKAGQGSGKSRCLLWEYREGPYTTADRHKSMIMYVINSHCRKCIGEDDVSACTSDGSNGFTKCGLFQYRIVSKRR